MPDQWSKLLTKSAITREDYQRDPQAVLDVLLRKLPSLELAVDVDDLRRVEGLVVGGLRELPVRW